MPTGCESSCPYMCEGQRGQGCGVLAPDPWVVQARRRESGRKGAGRVDGASPLVVREPRATHRTAPMPLRCGQGCEVLVGADARVQFVEGELPHASPTPCARAHLQLREAPQRGQQRRDHRWGCEIFKVHVRSAHVRAAAQQAQQGLDLALSPGGRAQLQPPHRGVDDAAPRAAREPQPARVAVQGATQRLLGRPRQRVQRENGAVGRHACGGAASVWTGQQGRRACGRGIRGGQQGQRRYETQHATTPTTLPCDAATVLITYMRRLVGGEDRARGRTWLASSPNSRLKPKQLPPLTEPTNRHRGGGGGGGSRCALPLCVAIQN